jgi:hypothetical protein
MNLGYKDFFASKYVLGQADIVDAIDAKLLESVRADRRVVNETNERRKSTTEAFLLWDRIPDELKNNIKAQFVEWAGFTPAEATPRKVNKVIAARLVKANAKGKTSTKGNAKSKKNKARRLPDILDRFHPRERRVNDSANTRKLADEIYPRDTPVQRWLSQYRNSREDIKTLTSKDFYANAFKSYVASHDGVGQLLASITIYNHKGLALSCNVCNTFRHLSYRNRRNFSTLAIPLFHIMSKFITATCVLNDYEPLDINDLAAHIVLVGGKFSTTILDSDSNHAILRDLIETDKYFAASKMYRRILNR